MKRFTLISTLLSSLMLAACSQTPVKKAPALPWMQELVCKRADSAQEVIVSVDKLNLAQNNTGCDGSNNPLCDIRIYQIMVESFKHGENGAQGYSMAWGPSEHKGNLRGIIDSLDYIKSVGVNGIWLTPVFEVKPVKGQDLTYDKLDGTGYYTSNYFAIDPKIGTEKEFKELVDKAHSKGLYVFLDGVFGHAKSNVATISPKGNKLYLSNVCRGILGHAEDMSLHLGTCFDTEKSLPFLEEVATYWISKYKIDGWRLDQAYQLAPEHWAKISAAVVAESQNPKNAYRLNGKKVQPLGYTVGEYWTDKPKFLEDNAFKGHAGISAFDFPLRAKILQSFALKGDICGKDISTLNTALLERNKYTQDAYLNTFLTNHDVLRLGDALQRAKYEKEGEKTKSYYNAHEAALSFIASVSGPLTIYYGDEYADEQPEFTTQPKDCATLNKCDDHVSRTGGRIDALNDNELLLKNRVAAMLKLRDSHKALARGIRTHIYSDDSVYIDLKEYDADKVLYVLNSSVNNRNITFKEDALTKLNLASCTFTDLLSAEDIDISSFEMPALTGKFIGVECASE